MDNDNEMQAAIDPKEAPASSNSAKSYRARGVTIGLAAGLLGGAAAGFAFGVPGLSSAASPSAVVQQTPDTTPDDSTPADTTPDDTTTDESTLSGLRNATARGAATTRRRRHDHGRTGRRGRRPAEGEPARPRRTVRPRRPGPPWCGGVFGHIFGEASDVVTGLLGIDADTLRTELLDGKSLADIATENGVEPQAVIDALVAEATTQIDQAVTDGRIDADRAAELKADVERHVTDLVNGELPDFGDFGGRHHGADDDSATATTSLPPPTPRPPPTPPPPPTTDPSSVATTDN